MTTTSPTGSELPRINPSAIDLGVLCAASTQEVRRRDHKVTTPEMQRGSLMHAANEAMVLQGPAGAAKVLDDGQAPTSTRAYVAAFWAWFDGRARADLCPALAERSLMGILAKGAAPLRAGLTVQPERLIETIPPPGAGFASRGKIDLTVVDEEAGEAWIFDYKAASGYRRSLEEANMQMLSYVAGIVRERPALRAVTVHIVGMLQLNVATLALHGPDRLALAVEASDTALLSIAGSLDVYTSGPHCGWCPARAVCAHALADAGRAMEAAEVRPYLDGAFVDEASVLRYLIARPVLEARLERANEAARAFVLARGGRGIVDPSSGRVWREREKGVDAIVDPLRVISALAADVGPDLAQTTVRTTKKAVEDALGDSGKKPKERRKFWDARRAEGCVVKQPRAEWAWAEEKEDAE